MKRFSLVLVLFLPLILIAQSNMDITGRISFRSVYTDYDQTSEIKPDSISDKQYAKTNVIPGLAEALNIALFARTRTLDITLLGDLQNNPWNQLNQFTNVNRISLSARFGSNEIVLGDFFDSGSEFFIQSREIRGAKLDLKFNNLWNSASFIRTKFSAGLVQQAYGIGTRLRNLYHQYENSGQYQRYFGSGLVTVGDTRYFDVSMKYLYGKDDQGSISMSINEPLTNQSIGGAIRTYLWNKHIQLFAESYLSKKDTLTASDIKDTAYKGGLDFRYKNFKLIALYQRIGYDYYTAGYPYLLNDRQGLHLVSGYYIPKLFSLTFEGEQYHDNLNQDNLRPQTETSSLITGFTTHFKGLPEFTLKWRFRNDDSNVIMDTIKTSKISRGLESGVAFALEAHRLSLSMIYLDMDDHSVLVSGSPLGTEQLIGSLNLFTRPSSGLFISGGAVYSSLKMTNKQENKNLYAYFSGRWDILPRLLKFEGNMNYILNDAANGGNQDMLSDYAQFGAEFSVEYFFNSNISFKLIGGTDFRHMGYTKSEALQVIANPDYGPWFFNSYETYDSMKYGAEINWLF